MTKRLHDLIWSALTTSPLDSAYRCIDERAEDGDEPLLTAQPSTATRRRELAAH